MTGTKEKSAIAAVLALAATLLLVACGEGTGPASSAAAVAAGRGRPGSLGIAAVRASLARPDAHETFVPEAPFGITSDLALLIPPDNPITPAKVRLGTQLFFDPRLSRDESLSCASCHDPTRAFTDGRPVSIGVEGRSGRRSAPTLINRILHPAQFWDGRAASLEEQALGPIADPNEMGLDPEEAAARLNAIAGYRIQFEAIFGGPATPTTIAQALATFERTLLAADSPQDWFVAARPFLGHELDESESRNARLVERRDRALAGARARPMSRAAMRGRELFFGKAECSLCHVGENFTDELYWNVGIGMNAAAPDRGREEHSKDEKDRGAFRTPTLRNVALTAPYMHDGSLRTLKEVVAHYNVGGMPNRRLSDRIRPLGLSEQEIADLLLFLEEGLSGPVPRIEPPLLP